MRWRKLTVAWFLALAVAAKAQPAGFFEKVAPAVWQKASQNPQGELEVILALHLPREAEPEVFAPKRLAAIGETADAVAQQVTAFGGSVLARYRYIPAVACRIPAAALPYLAELPSVAQVTLNWQVRAFDAEGEQLMRVPEVRALGWTGENIGIAVLDTGVDYNHPELSPGGTDASAKTVKLWDAVNNDADPLDDQGHGTAVASVAAGKTLGVARAGRVVAVKVLDAQGRGKGNQILTGIDKVLASIQAGNPYNIKVLNMSLGGYDDTEWPPGPGACDELDSATFNAFQSLRQAGVLVVVAAGNGGCTNGVAWPACLSNALAVGAVYDANIGPVAFGEGQCTGASGCIDLFTQADQVTCYSDSGEKLDVWAPGSETRAAHKGGGMAAFHGTSAAAPYVAGVAALLSQAVPSRSSEALFTALRSTGKPITDPRNNITRNRVDALQALQALQQRYSYYLTGIARWPGFPPAYWYSSAAIFNPGDTPAQVKLTFLSSNANPQPVTFSLAAKAQASWNDVLAQAFGVSSQAVGAILVESDQPLRVLARTYSQVQVRQGDGSLAWGSMGQFIEGVEVSNAFTAGQVGYFTNLRSDPPFRTNVEFVNLGSDTVQVQVDFFANNGSAVNTLTMDIPPQRRTQVSKALAEGVAGAYAKVRVLTPGGKVIGIASVVDGVSTDPTTIPLWVP
jgi:hypothetical protein